MSRASLSVPEVLDRLEAHYGHQPPNWPTDPYLFLIWWHCGYPASDSACAKGWEALNKEIGTGPEQILAARPADLAKALKAGGMVPELRATRLTRSGRVTFHSSRQNPGGQPSLSISVPQAPSAMMRLLSGRERAARCGACSTPQRARG